MSQNEIKVINDNTFKIIQSAVNKMVNLIKPTFGPAGNKVIIESTKYFSPLVVDDGVQIAREFQLDIPEENAVVKVIRETASKTNDRVGDGTTGALIMLQAIINEVGKKSRIDGNIISKELKLAVGEAKEQLLKSTKEIKTKAELKKAALVSFDDEHTASLLSELFFKLGKEATITIERSQTMKTYHEMSKGLTLDKGYISPYMVNNPQRMEGIIDKPYILLTDYKITQGEDIMPIVNLMAKEQKFGLVIIAENVEGQALATLVINEPQVMNPQTKKPGIFSSIAITIPTTSDDKKSFLEDLAMITGAKVFSEEKGFTIKEATIEDLGRADKFICRRDESIIVKPKGNKSAIKNAIDNLRKLYKSEKSEVRKKKIEKRLSMFTNSLAVIKVGAPTENEQKSLKYKVEDAVNSIKSAYKHGVVCGGGMSLARIKTSSHILNEALKYPSRQLFDNMGEDGNITLKPNEARNMVTGEVGNFMDVGVIDPVNVLIAAIESAVSIATLLLTSSGMIIESPKEEK